MTTEQSAFENDCLDWYDRMYRKQIEHQKRLIMRLNKAEILCLAKHYEIKNPHYYTDPGEWKGGGKEELAGEIAERMVE